MNFLHIGIGIVVAYVAWTFFRNRFLLQHGSAMHESLMYEIPEGFFVAERRKEEVFLQNSGEDGDITISIATFVLPGSMTERQERVDVLVGSFFASLDINASQVTQQPTWTSLAGIPWNVSDAVSPEPEVYARLHYVTVARGYVGVALVSEPHCKERGLHAVGCILTSLVLLNSISEA